MSTMKNKVALVTGAGSGIGEACVMAFAREGAKVVLSDIVGEDADRVLKAVQELGGEGTVVRSDVSRAMDNEHQVAIALQAYGRLDIAVNNAGIGGPAAPTGEYPLDGWEQVIGVNLNGVFYGMRYQIPAMLKTGGGSIINMSSILGQVGFAYSSAYVAAKHAVVGLTKNAAMEYAAQGIRVNSVGPGFIRTPLLDKHLTEEQLASIAALHPIGRLGRAEEVAELVLWLASDKASFVTGSYYAVDGGYLTR
ncbi:MAG: SDR family oxidoreductase [Flavobacteriales bacterium]|nr:MAG: SDR family oxidoreductase [Flavobacteriales bacterium]